MIIRTKVRLILSHLIKRTKSRINKIEVKTKFIIFITLCSVVSVRSLLIIILAKLKHFVTKKMKKVINTILLLAVIALFVVEAALLADC